MADGKWITDLDPETPAEEAARRVLDLRLAAVRDRLPLAAERADEDAEHVHQLRVATRRAGAALRIFRPLLPKDEFREAKDVLRAVRQAAGAARDWDVFLEALGESSALSQPAAATAGVFLTGYALGERAAAQDTLTAVVASHGEAVEQLGETVTQAARPARVDGLRTTGELAADHLGKLFQEFAREIAANPTAPAELHQLRITAKRVRYAMEVFAGIHAAEFRGVLYPAVEKAQELLGVVQDGHVALERLAGIRERLTAVRPGVAEMVGPGLKAYAAERWERAAEAETGFRAWVREWKELVAAHPLSELLATVPAVPDATAG